MQIFWKICAVSGMLAALFYLSGEDPRFCKRRVKQYPAPLSGGFQSPTEIKASGGSQPRKEEGASHLARRGKNAEAFLNSVGERELNLRRAILVTAVMRYARKMKFPLQCDSRHVPVIMKKILSYNNVKKGTFL